MKKHLSLILLALILLGGLLNLSLGAVSSKSVTADLSGTWAFTFDLTSYSTKGSATKGAKQGSPMIIAKRASKTVTFVLEQQGEKLTVTCCEPEEKMTGTVRGNEVTFEREVSREGQTQKITYSGTIETSSKMTGTRKFIGASDQSPQKWIATRKDR